MPEDIDSKPLIELTTVARRPKIAIDDELYEILSPDELSIVDCHRFAAWGNRIDALMAKASLSQKEERELGTILSDLSDRIMVGVPKDQRTKLGDAQRMEVAEVFTRLPLRKRLARLAAGGETTAGGPNGASSAPDPNDSTAAIGIGATVVDRKPGGGGGKT